LPEPNQFSLLFFDFGFKKFPLRWERVRVRKPRMNHKVILLLLAASALICSNLTEAQQQGKIFSIGFLDNGTASGSVVLVDAFRQELSKLGWVERKNITIEYRFAESKGDRQLKELAADLVASCLMGQTPLNSTGALPPMSIRF